MMLATNFNLFGVGSLSSHIWMGTYPQRDETGEVFEPIKWKVLVQDEDGYYLVSENIIVNFTLN